MAELAALNIAKSLLQQLSSPAKDEFLLLFNSDTELKKLENTIRTIKDVLHDAEQRKATNTDIGGWLSRLKDEMYKADDLFDTLSTRALRKKVILGNKFRKEMKIFFSKSNQVAFIFKTAHEVKELRERLDVIAKDIGQFGWLRDNKVYDQRPVIRRSAEHSYIAEDEVIGREKEKEELLRLLLADAGAEERVSVIAVVGIGGQGKTAIAQLLYNAKETEEFFELRLWACINDFSDLKAALEEITGTKADFVEELQNRLRAKINGKKFLLVIDDVWDDIREQWLRLKGLLDAGERGSKILMTTRSETVARNLATVRPHYALGELSDEYAWKLFEKMAFDSNNEEENKTKKEPGRQIMKKCPKVPLAIRTVGSFLYSKDTKQWSEFADNELMKALPDRENIVMHVLKISYDDLPFPVKQCFAYCSLFPKDYRFDQTTLIHLWMAQGFLETSDENPCLEDVGESYFLYLVQRCFFQNVKVGWDGDTISCKMHDLFHDLSVQINDDSGRHFLDEEITSSLLEREGIRSLVSRNTGFVERALLDGVLLNLTSLRTLSLRQLDVEEIPSSIGKLDHLRYLDLTDSDKLIRLPNAICKLQNMLILRLEGCKNLIKLPDDLQKLISLRYLKIDGCDRLEYIPSGLEKLISVVRLDRLIVHKDHGGLRCLKHLNNLTGGIRIEFPRGGWKNCVADAEESMLSSKTKLSGLSIRSPNWGYVIPPVEEFPEASEEFPEADELFYRLQPSNSISHLDVRGYIGVKFPDWLSSLHNLVELKLFHCNRCHELPQLRHLLQLKELTLWSIPLLEYVENDMCYDSGPFFPSLEYLNISSMPRLKGWRRPEVCGAHDSGFPRISRLLVLHCPQLTSMPLCSFVEVMSLTYVSVILVKQLLRLPNAVEMVPTCSRLNVLSFQGITDLAFLPEELENSSLVARRFTVFDCPNFKRSSLFYLVQKLPSLESLRFRGFEATESLIEVENMAKDGMPWRWLKRLKMLEFEFGSDRVGTHLLNGLHHLTRLEHLTIYGSVPKDEDMQWTAPPNLKHLSIWNMEEVAGLNRVIRQSKNLQSFNVDFCRKIDEHELNKLPWEDLSGLRQLSFHLVSSMRSLPDKCRHLMVLEDLTIEFCEEITSLPDWVTRLTSLEIVDCRKLKENCRKPAGSCWPLIRDIPYLSIRNSLNS